MHTFSKHILSAVKRTIDYNCGRMGVGKLCLGRLRVWGEILLFPIQTPGKQTGCNKIAPFVQKADSPSNVASSLERSIKIYTLG